jgi:3-isopropylmalate dehydratase small subunit
VQRLQGLWVCGSDHRAALIAEEFNSLFFRNAVNAGLAAVTAPDPQAHPGSSHGVLQG